MDVSPLLRYIDDYWPRIIRHNRNHEATRIGLPHAYMVPSDGAMFQEMYYWDSYFIALGLVGTPHEQLIVDMTENMAYLFRRFGIIPNASRLYFLSRSQPPFFTRMVWLAYEVKRRREEPDADAFLRRMMRVAEHEHETVWMGLKQPHHRQMYAGLSRYFDINYLDILASCESGWDHSTRCYDRWLEHLPVDLNSILYVREQDMARAADVLKNPRRAAMWRERAERRVIAMQRLMWDEGEGFYFDYDYIKEGRCATASLAGYYPMWAGIATREQAERMVRDWLPHFDYPGGLVTSMDEQVGRQWAYPNGWAPLQWIVTEGLDRYGYTEEAKWLRAKWCTNCFSVFEASGTMWEKYNVIDPSGHPEGGLYGSVTGFGWSNGVFVDFARKLEWAPDPLKTSKLVT